MTMAPPQDAAVDEAVALFYATFFPDADAATRPPRAALTIAAAPGRVNLIGEHTDYNDGFVLPLALDKYTVVVGMRHADGAAPTSRVISTEFSDRVVEFPADQSLSPGVPRSWANYVQGVTAMYLSHLQQHKSSTRALPVLAAIASRVPLGSGLSSSAAVEVSFATFLEAVYGLRDVVTKQQKALLCQRAEHEYCNVPCGIMDQFISTFGQRNAALLIDCRAQTPTPVAFQDPGIVVVVCNSNVQHELCGTEYSDRVRQCRAAVAALQHKFPQVAALRDATLAQLEAVRDALPPLVFVRARHVITEIERTTRAAALIRARAYAEVGALMLASHASLRDDYEVSTPQLDALVEAARAAPGVFGARMTGGGFGGCIVALVERAHAPALMDTLDAGYPTARFGDHAIPRPSSFVTTIGHGARVLQHGAPL